MPLAPPVKITRLPSSPRMVAASGRSHLSGRDIHQGRGPHPHPGGGGGAHHHGGGGGGAQPHQGQGAKPGPTKTRGPMKPRLKPGRTKTPPRGPTNPKPPRGPTKPPRKPGATKPPRKPGPSDKSAPPATLGRSGVCSQGHHQRHGDHSEAEGKHGLPHMIAVAQRWCAAGYTRANPAQQLGITLNSTLRSSASDRSSAPVPIRLFFDPTPVAMR